MASKLSVLILFLVLYCLTSSVTGRGIFGTSISLIKAKVKSEKRGVDNNENAVKPLGKKKSSKKSILDDKNKDSVNLSQSPTEIAAGQHEPLEKAEKIIQIIVPVVYLAAYYLIFKLDFENKAVLQFARFSFCIYLVGSHLFYRLLRSKIEKTNDTSLVKPRSLPGMNIMEMFGLGGGKKTDDREATPLTAKEYDLAELEKTMSSLLMEVATVTYLHFVNKATKPLFLIPLAGLMNKVNSPIIKIHIFGKQAVGALARPFASAFEQAMENMSKKSGVNEKQEGAVGTSDGEDQAVPLLPGAERGEQDEAVEPLSTDTVLFDEQVELVESGTTGEVDEDAPAVAMDDNDEIQEEDDATETYEGEQESEAVLQSEDEVEISSVEGLYAVSSDSVEAGADESELGVPSENEEEDEDEGGDGGGIDSDDDAEEFEEQDADDDDEGEAEEQAEGDDKGQE